MNKKDQGSPAPEGPLAPGATAPNFSLHDTPDPTVSLSELRGRPVILVFYPVDWSPVCGSELALYNELLPEFQHFSATLLGISVDGAWCHIAFARDRKLKFPLLAVHAVARTYGVYRQHDGTAERALFVLDAESVIRWGYVSPVGVNPVTDHATLDRMTQAGIIPVTTNVVVTEVQRTWNRPDAAQYGALYGEFAPHYRAVAESYQKAQEGAGQLKK